MLQLELRDRQLRSMDAVIVRLRTVGERESYGVCCWVVRGSAQATLAISLRVRHIGIKESRPDSGGQRCR